MAFQDFDEITERRRAAKEQNFKRRVITISIVSGVALLALIGAGVFALVSRAESHQDSATATAAAVPPADADSQSHKIIKAICNATDYAAKCEQALSQATGNQTASPRDFLKAAIDAAKDELHQAFNKTSSFKFHTPQEKAAFEDCEALMEDALNELDASVSAVADDSAGGLSSRTPDLNSWLSAVISYQQTCVDGFPEGKLKSNMERLFKASREFTSNSLALVTEISNLLSAFDVTELLPRHLQELASSPAPARAPLPINMNAPSLDDYGFPAWMEEDDRRTTNANFEKPTPNVTVAKDGSGQFKTINEALAAIPATYDGRYVIYVKQGIYEETVTLTRTMVNVTMYGDGAQKSIITGSKNFVDGVRTFQTASFVAQGDGFNGRAMGFRNTAGPAKHQAVAARIQSDRAIFINCRFEGYQDTLYAQAHRQFYRSCVIAGTVDFIFGDAASIFQNCMIVVRRPLENQQNIVTAQGRTEKQQTTGIVLHNCRILADRTLEPVKNSIRSYLGRPWKEFSRTIVMESTIEDFIHPDGWLPWQGDFALSTLYYAEYNNKGPGAKIDKRVKWPGYKSVITKEEANQYTVQNFLPGDWVNVKGVPLRPTLYQ